ncbi:monocarboxylate transporter 3-like [Diadema antillarum]|uniref:monocarboxylate transporter 3-like n=1 Tax=Diadema antillarum TaxID=105358 RepID=UPI003A8ADF88
MGVEVKESQDRWKYVVMGAKFCLDCLTQGLLKAFGVLVPPLVQKLDTDYGTIGFMLAMELTVFFLACPLSSVASRKIPPRTLCIVGSVGASVAIMVSGYLSSTLWFGVAMFLTGFLSSPINQISHVVLHQYYGERFGYANSMCLMGCLVGGIAFPVLTSSLLESYGLEGALLCIGGVFLNCVPIAMTLRPPSDFVEATCPVPFIGDTQKCSTEEQEPCLPSKDSDNVMELSSLEHPTPPDSDPPGNSETEPPLSMWGRWWHFVWVELGVRALVQEWAFTVLFMPCKVILQVAMVSWTLFIVSFGMSKGYEEPEAAYLPLVGSIGGFIFQGLITVILHYRQRWGAALFIINMISLAAAMCLYPAHTSFAYLLACSFFAGGGIFAGFAASYAVLVTYVSEANFTGMLSTKLFITGIGVVVSGYVTGKLYDVTGSLDVVFRIVGGMCAVTVLLTVALVSLKRYQKGKASKAVESGSGLGTVV